MPSLAFADDNTVLCLEGAASTLDRVAIIAVGASCRSPSCVGHAGESLSPFLRRSREGQGSTTTGRRGEAEADRRTGGCPAGFYGAGCAICPPGYYCLADNILRIWCVHR